jgi:hypothetical protein
MVSGILLQTFERATYGRFSGSLRLREHFRQGERGWL